MRCSTIADIFLVLVLIQCPFITGFWFKPKPTTKVCKSDDYPRSKYAPNDAENDYFIGFVSLIKSKFGRRRSFNLKIFPWSTLAHSFLMFRGQIFEWGSSNRPATDRKPSDCKIMSWSFGGKLRGKSRCLVSDAMDFAHNYRQEYGVYNLFFNNCHYFVNRLAAYLDRNCGR